MTIRNLLIFLLTLMGLLILLSSGWEIREIRAKLNAAQWVHQSNRVADISLRASGVMAMERGITAAILSHPAQASPDMLYEMARQRHDGDALYRSIMATASELPSLSQVDDTHPLRRGLQQLAQHHDTMETARRQVDQRIANEAVELDESQWITLATRYVEALSELRDATAHPMPNNIYSYTTNPLIKDALFNVSEYAGRERAVIGSAIAQQRPLSEIERARLQRYRDIVEASLARIETLIQQLPDIPALQRPKLSWIPAFSMSIRPFDLPSIEPTVKAPTIRSAQPNGTSKPPRASARCCRFRKSSVIISKPASTSCVTASCSRWPWRSSPSSQP
ncbi:nitrate- and nitrite sensing domain-containing protein [Halomonas sp. BC04]|uniref:nitrate- and nitrite sensing domain-containing protein n=1 Tax=Halomonas sp. BC04 TaxID=1403540 RepID=UPI0003ED625D|nr:nitrate- and nitrite sensing domain-containing protein [Halomonas sp. BC04]EWH01959.1 hypothetical protein Q427_11270 [Halomonas sp. BC04]